MNEPGQVFGPDNDPMVVVVERSLVLADDDPAGWIAVDSYRRLAGDNDVLLVPTELIGIVLVANVFPNVFRRFWCWVGRCLDVGNSGRWDVGDGALAAFRRAVSLRFTAVAFARIECPVAALADSLL